MKRNLFTFAAAVVATTLLLAGIRYNFFHTAKKTNTGEFEEYDEYDGDMSFNRAAREEWEFNRLKDPNTGKIPDNIRAKELEFAATLPRTEVFKKSGGDIWEKAGPWNIGGRTRAIAIDVTNEKVLVAAQVTGGLWRSEDGGKTWNKTTTQTQVNAITCVSQDTRPGKTHIWYAATGELSGSSASKGGAYFSGNGMLKSTDGGKSWQPLVNTVVNTPQFDADYDGAWNIATSPITGSGNDTAIVYAALYGGIYRSTNGGTTWQRKRGGSSTGNVSYYTDVAVTKTGVVYATLSSEGPNRGIWRSTDNGTTWTSIIPSGFPAQYQRMVIALVPQDENHLYILAYTPNSGKMTKDFKGTEEWNSIWKYTYLSGDGSGTGGRWEDRSASIPDFPGDFETFNAQGGYNYVLKVHPGDSNILFLGGTGLFRSTDAFRTNTKISRIGGFALGSSRPDLKLWENHHPDQHNLVFFKSDPNKAISTNDGGIAYTDNIKAQPLVWQSLNNGFLTTQFYTIAINESKPGDFTIIGGLQDNGTLFTNQHDVYKPWTQVFSYDGAFCHVANNGLDYYVTKQEAGLYRIRLDAGNNRVQNVRIDPPGYNNYRFINPFCVDPNKDSRFFVLHDTTILRHDDVTQYVLKNTLDSTRTPGNWQEMTNCRTRSQITAVSMSVQPSGILFYGTEDGQLFKVNNAITGNPLPVSIKGTNFPSGGNINNICVHPDDADKLIVVFTNYGIPSLFYTENGGQNWTDISGNLEQFPNGTGNGPSCRWAAFVKTETGYGVLVATSVGLYGTPTLNGNSTVWIQQAPFTIGNAICEMIKVRNSDSRVVVATHGAGVYASAINRNWHLNGIEENTKNTIQLSVYPNPATDAITVNALGNAPKNLTYSIYDVSGKKLIQANDGDDPIQFNIETLAAGTYIVRAETKNTAGSQFFIKR